ncbi:DUF3299 domain-containing protein [Nitrosomonas marina]|uniref:Lipoprotein n=1 Tax=Nitrosomonas marina TaxID=917 RepID=A0A1H8DDQ2_9PROT|nr:DUF3299 domain-containing protein [Nitrosomonas marina]SEN04698.1 hypothetical protein SAMN05216325_106152 [Nitrosomonas marina]
MKPEFISRTILLIGLISAMIIGCSQNESNSIPDKGTGKHASLGSAQETKKNLYRTIEWIDLMPQDDLDALMNPPDYLDEIEDGSDDDQLSNQLMLAIDQTSDDRYMQALTSTRVMPEFDNLNIRLPGFIVPLEFDAQLNVTRFFLVPFFGACIHVPPPPPNQIVYGIFEQGLKLEALHEPVWLTGRLRTTLTENDVATAAYAMEVTSVTKYTD